MAATEALRVTLAVVRALADVGVDCVVGGSLASSLQGLPRASQDVDLVADLREEHVSRLVAALAPSFYVDEERARDAVRGGTSFNLIHLETLFKVDLFVVGDDALARQQVERRQRLVVGESPRQTLDVATAEDTVLQKLRWYRRGNEVSELQWTDVLGVLRVQGPRLDLGYLRRSATAAGVEDLLERALQEAGAAPG